MSRKLIIEIITALLIVLFVYAGLSKLLDHHTFSLQLARSPLLGSWAFVIAWVLPIGELLLAAALVIPATRLLGLYASSILLIVFTLYLVYMLSFSTHLPCTCGGIISTLSWKQHVGFNTVFILLAAGGIWLERTRASDYHIVGSTA